MPGITLFADDVESFVSLIQKKAHQKEMKWVKFAKSIQEIRQILSNFNVARLIVDWIFEGEQEDGVTVLEKAREKKSSTELFLVTGHPLNPDILERLDRIDAKVIEKNTLNWDRLLRLLNGEQLEEDLFLSEGQQVDIGELSLRLEEEESKNERLHSLVGKLADDIVNEISVEMDKIKNKDEKTLFIGTRKLTINQLKNEIQMQTHIGLKLIELHRKLKNREKGIKIE